MLFTADTRQIAFLALKNIYQKQASKLEIELSELAQMTENK